MKYIITISISIWVSSIIATKVANNAAEKVEGKLNNRIEIMEQQLNIN